MNLNEIQFSPTNVRKPKRIAEDAINCEYLHPYTGQWLQFTATPHDEYGHGRDAYAYFVDKGI